jgi:hypothetical protein
MLACGDEARDVAGGADTGVSPSDECALPLEPTIGRYVMTQRLATADGSLTMWVAREPDDGHIDRPGADARGGTEPYQLVRAWIDSAEEPGTCIRDRGALTYSFVHHNWDDTWTVTTPRARYTGREVFDPLNGATWTFTLEARDAGGAPLFGPIELVQQGCSVSDPRLITPCGYRVPFGG